jgi:aldehyde:ferredoxin oxidoreductase
VQIPYFGRGARIDLGSGSIHLETLDEAFYRKFLGGKGLGALLLLNNLKPLTDPLSPENPLIFLTGPLTGSPYPSASRGTVVTKSPLTGTFLDSNIGGGFANALKLAGLDYLIIQGKSEMPVWLLVDNSGISFRDARLIWGQSTTESESSIRNGLDGSGIEVATIGRAGERQVLFASIACGGRMFGRGGAGAVMGSKNLKAIALAGKSDLPWFRTEAFMAEARKAREKIRMNPSTKKGGPFPLYGTTFTTNVTNTMGVLPTRNWQEATFEGAEKLYDTAFFARKVKSKTCFQCPIACSRIVTMGAGNQGDAAAEVRCPEYETVYVFGPNCGISDLDTVIRANFLCEEYGLDTISCGCVASFLMECAQRGIVGQNDLHPLPRFGDSDALLDTIKYIGEGGETGNPLIKGTKRLSETVGQGTTRFAMCVKGMELPGYDPRGMKAMALLYATADRGGCHVRGSSLRAELLCLPTPVDRFSYEGKAAMVAGMQPIYVMMNSYSGCLFSAFALTIDDYAGVLSALFEEKMTTQDLVARGRDIWNLTRYFNCREGFSREDDSLPARLFEDPVPAGPAKGHVIVRGRFEAMKDEYYTLVGWDKDGRPAIDPEEYKI